MKLLSAILLFLLSISSFAFTLPACNEDSSSYEVCGKSIVQHYYNTQYNMDVDLNEVDGGGYYVSTSNSTHQKTIKALNNLDVEITPTNYAQLINEAVTLYYVFDLYDMYIATIYAVDKNYQISKVLDQLYADSIYPYDWEYIEDWSDVDELEYFTQFFGLSDDDFFDIQ